MMKRRALLSFGILGSALYALFAFACDDDTVRSKSSGESHFLDYCTSDCARDLECIEGLCTRSCTVDDACEGLPAGVTCTEPGSSDDTAVCDVGCSANRECASLGDGFECNAGFCRRGQPVQGTGGRSPGGNTGGTTGGTTGGAPPNNDGGTTGGTPPGEGGIGPAGRAGYCAQALDSEGCEALGCLPVAGSAVRRLTGGGGTSPVCEDVGEASDFLGCSIGSGGAINECFCSESDPSACLEAPSSLRSARSTWDRIKARDSSCVCVLEPPP